MHIKLINRFLNYNNYKVKCSIGKRGISSKKKEGDYKTPRGTFKFNKVYYRKDRILKIKTKLPTFVIKRNMGWCDDPRSKKYNKLISFPYKYTAEKLHLRKKIYDIILVLDYNINPIKKNAGSAIFLHIATKVFSPTKGCVAISKSDMINLLRGLNKSSRLTIY